MDPSCAFSSAANFNGTAIPAGETLWFSNVVKISGVKDAPVTIGMTQTTVSFTASGTPYAVSLPDSQVTFDPNATSATISYGAGGWTETVPAKVSGNVLVGSGQYPVTSDLPGGIKDVTMSANFTTSQSGVTLQWAWSAAAYSLFNTDDSALGVKPVDDNKVSQYQNSDHAGTPESYKTDVVGGAMGGGGSNYTGGLSGTSSVTPCLYVATPTPSPTPSPLAGPGNVYVADGGSGTVKEMIAVNGVIPSSPTILTFSQEPWVPTGVAVDNSGNVYVADPNANKVWQMQAVNGSLPSSPTTVSIGSGFNYPFEVAVDKSGNVFVADVRNNAIKEIVAPAYTTVNVLGTGLGSPLGVALDASGNIFVADNLNGAVKEILAPGYTTTITVASGFAAPYGVAVDSSGNIYVADTGSNHAIYEIMAVNGSIPPSPSIRTLDTAFSAPEGVMVDPSGNVWVSSGEDNTVVEIEAVNGSIPPSPTTRVFPFDYPGNTAIH